MMHLFIINIQNTLYQDAVHCQGVMLPVDSLLAFNDVAVQSKVRMHGNSAMAMKKLDLILVANRTQSISIHSFESSNTSPLSKTKDRYFPKKSRVDDFATAAMEAEIRKHDRLVVHGMAYVNSLTPAELKRWIPKPDKKPKLCINVNVVNRDVPYVDAFVMTLMESSSHDPSRLTSYAEMNFINTEHRIKRQSFEHLHQTLSKLPFFNIHNLSTFTPVPGQQLKQNETKAMAQYRKQWMADYIAGLNICLQSNLTWCLMIESDTVVPINFIDYLDEFVIQPEGEKPSGAMISLFSFYNANDIHKNSIDDKNYSEHQYEHDRAKSNMERYAAHEDLYRANFTVKETKFGYGAVAMLYTRDVVKKLVDFLKKNVENPIDYADVLLNVHFPLRSNVPRRQIDPSLVNHIGYYSDRMRRYHNNVTFPIMVTDVRFQFDAGEISGTDLQASK
jgi:hypothetical protein